MKGTKRQSGEGGQALVELACVMPIVIFFVAACFRLTVIFFTYMSVLNATRDIGRWLAVHPHTVDATAVTTIKSGYPPGSFRPA